MAEAAASIAAQFEIGGEITRLERLGIGHINDTFIGRTVGKAGRRYLFQRINQSIFPDVAALMQNVWRVTAHLQAKGVPTLTLVPTNQGDLFYRDPDDGECWRAFPFIGGTSSVGVTSSTAQAEQAAFAFGEFARGLSDLPPPRLHETIPDFHNTPKRFADFLAAVAADPSNRAISAKPEIESAMAGAGWVGKIYAAQAAGSIPERIAHNDAKIENVLFDTAGERAICVVDLDTVMPGTLLHDFGDLVRSAAATAGEDERNLEGVGLSVDTFTGLARGFIGACGQELTKTERELLPFAGKLITYEQSLRFLTDYLQGDRYYRTQRENQNLDRARNQLKLVAILESKGEDLANICRGIG